jgi:hypothetical protein
MGNHYNPGNYNTINVIEFSGLFGEDETAGAWLAIAKYVYY